MTSLLLLNFGIMFGNFALWCSLKKYRSFNEIYNKAHESDNKRGVSKKEIGEINLSTLILFFIPFLNIITLLILIFVSLCLEKFDREEK